jgi:hypothetical protein
MAELPDAPWVKKDELPDAPWATESEPSTARALAGGALQGAIFDPVTGINQLIEHATDNKIGMPESVKKWLEDYKDKYTSGTAGKVGEGIGTIGSFLIPGSAIARGVGLLPKAGRALSTGGRVLAGAGLGAAGGAIQPVDESEGDFAKQKQAQILGGTLAGGMLGTPAAAPMLATSALVEAYKRFGAGPVLIALSGLYPSLRALAGQHGLAQGASRLAGPIERATMRPGAQYAVGRAAGAFAGPPGAELMENLDDR